MSDPRLPSDMDDYMKTARWGEHHEQWHFEQRYDWWRRKAELGHPGASEAVAYADAKGWGRAPFQEGAPGHGLQFLAMHRAMIQLLSESFPQHLEFLAGWTTPPQDPASPDDPVVGSALFDSEKAAGIVVVEDTPHDFADEDAFALFLETSLRPTASDTLATSLDKRTGLHNYLHNRWMDEASPVNLGDPTVNIFNARFWRLHGWIDRLWTRFRDAKELRDDDPDYIALIQDYRHMMEHGGHHHIAGADGPVLMRPDVLRRAFVE